MTTHRENIIDRSFEDGRIVLFARSDTKKPMIDHWLSAPMTTGYVIKSPAWCIPV